jgi:hypothetical protein
MAVIHYLGCFWYATTLVGFDHTWLNYHGFDADNWSYQYVTSFHWAITQFTPSSMHVQPQNILERIFAITVIVLGLVGFSYLVGSITGSLTELRKLKEEESKQFWNLRRFLKKAAVPKDLQVRIEKYVEHAWQVQKTTANPRTIPMYQMLTVQLRNELNCAIFLPVLEVHPLFTFLSEKATVATQRIATEGLSRQLLARSEAMFHVEEISYQLGFVTVGRLQYIRTLPDGQQVKEFVDADEDWITEPAIWMPEWVTLGDLMAVTVSEIVQVSAKGFAEAIKRTPQVYLRMCIYANNFVNWINEKEFEELSDICQGDELTDLIEGMLLSEDEKEDGKSIRAPIEKTVSKTKTGFFH